MSKTDPFFFLAGTTPAAKILHLKSKTSWDIIPSFPPLKIKKREKNFGIAMHNKRLLYCMEL